MRDLRRRPHGHLLTRGVDHDRARLHERGDQALLAVLALDDDAVAACLLDRLVDVATRAGARQSRTSRTRSCWCRGRGARGPCPRRPPSGRGPRQLLVVDVDQLGGVTGLRGRARDETATISPAKVTRSTATGGWAGVTCSGVIGQALGSAPCSSATSWPVITVDDVGRRLGRRRVDVGDLRVGEGAAHHREVQHPGELDVVGPAGAAGDQPLVLLAAAVPPDLAAGASWVESSASTFSAWPVRPVAPGCPLPGGVLNGADDVVVAGAAAQVALEPCGSPPRWGSGCR